MQGNIKQVFPGGNTSKGFHSFYDYILPQDEARRIIVIKGGPGVGKSTFMKKIAMEMVNRGYDVEFMHCSSDNDSLDGVVIPAIKVALVDGTSPHIVDPKNPGCVDEIIHLGDYWNEEGLRKNRDNIINTNREVGKHFARAYKYLSAAKAIYDDSEVIVADAMNKAKINQVIDELTNLIFKNCKTAHEVGKDRHLFGSAITPEGLKNYLPTFIGRQMNIIILRGLPGTGLHKITSKITETSLAKGFYTECYHCPMNSDRIEHILIPGLDVVVTTSNEYHLSEVENPLEVIDMNSYLDEKVLNKYKEELSFDKIQFDNLLKKGISTLGKAKELHDQMETFYIPNMDFDKVQEVWEKTMDRILKYEKEIY